MRPAARDMLGFLRECPEALSGDSLSGDGVCLFSSNSGIEASIKVEKSDMLCGRSMINFESEPERE
jgi:hypothetical protein